MRPTALKHRAPTLRETAILDAFCQSQGLWHDGQGNVLEVQLLTATQAAQAQRQIEDEAAQRAGYASAWTRDQALQAAINGALRGAMAVVGPPATRDAATSPEEDLDHVLASVGWERA